MDTYKEVMFYDNDGDNTVCGICPHYCIIKPGCSGICKNKINSGGKLYLKAYAKPCALSIDPIEKKPLFHFMPQSHTLSLAVTGCNFRCLNCQNHNISQAAPEKIAQFNATPEDIVNIALEKKCSSISYTYTEPSVFYEYMYDIAKEAHKHKLKNVMVSNGYINKKPLQALIPYLDAVNIDLKTFDADKHFKLTGGHLQNVLDTVLLLKDTKIWLEFTHLIIPKWTDDKASIKTLCNWLVENNLHHFPLHLSRFYPQYKLKDLPQTEPELMEAAIETAKQTGLKHVYAGNMTGHPNESTYCPECAKLLIQRYDFSVSEINISNNRCRFCNSCIAGVW